MEGRDFMNDLKQMWTINGLLKDSNNDGVPDAVNVQIQGLSPNCTPKGLVDFCARVGLETTGLSFPIITINNETDYTINLRIEQNPYAECSCILKDGHSIELISESEVGLSKTLRWLAASWPYAVDGKKDKVIRIDFRKTTFQLTFVEGDKSEWFLIKQTKSFEVKSFESLSNLTDLWTTNGFFQSGRIDINSKLNIHFSFLSDPTPGILEKAAEFTARMGLCSTGIQFPLTSDSQWTRGAELNFIIDTSKNNQCKVYLSENDPLDGASVHFEGKSQAVENALTYFTTARLVEEGGTFGSWENIAIEEPLTPLLFEKDWFDKGEKVDFIEYLESWLNEGIILSANHVAIEAYISEPYKIRRELSQFVLDRLGSLGESVETHIRSAFKPGYHWIEEEVIPSLKNVIGIEEIEIHCKKESNLDGLELPIRWIQELYPVDLLLSKSLGISSNAVEFLLEDNQEATYNFIVKNNEGQIIFSETLLVPTAEIDYIDGIHKVYPTTGNIKLLIDGEVIREKHNPTDRERFWNYFKKEILEKLPGILPLSEAGRGVYFPFFSKLSINVEMSEEEKKLGIDEERMSSLEALHEDLYFNTLDYFTNYGLNSVGKEWTTPGGVHPFIRAVDGVSPSARIKLYGLEVKEKPEVSTHSLYFNDKKTEPESCILKVKQNNKEQTIEVNGDDRGKRKSLDWPEEVKDLQKISGLSVWMGATSYGGEPIPVIELTKPGPSDFTSPHKLSLFKPTILIETGHHPNEVSSMPAVRGLLKDIATTQAGILNHVNLVVVPCANPDGAKLHQRMTRDNPEWKHHAARFNAVGLEHSLLRYQKSIFGEADVIPKIIHRWLPDVVIDDHGIPAHEWIQPFAGYNSPPRFPQSYWIPISFIYGITKRLNNEKYPRHSNLLDTMINKITQKIGQDQVVSSKNKYFQQRYEKYGHQWLPDVFPLEKADQMIFYQWPIEVNTESTSVISRYPDWCSLEFISEAADETVYGDTLEQCIKAHQLFDLAVIEAVSESRPVIHTRFEDEWIKYTRQRPITINE